MDAGAIGLWSTLSAPACAAYGVAAAQAERVGGTAGKIGPAGIFVFIVLAALAVASARTAPDALSCLFLVTMLSYLAAYDLGVMAVPVTPLLMAIVLGLGVGVIEG